MEEKPGWIDTRFSVQKALMWIVSGLVAVVLWLGNWAYGIQKQVDQTTADNLEQNRHFTRVESEIQQQRSDVNQQLHDIGDDVKEIRNYLMNNSAANRPGIQRWSK